MASDDALQRDTVEDTSFGLDADGVNMWTDPTWDDIVFGELKSNISSADESDEQHGCRSDTGGSCSVFSCSSSRGATECKSGSCHCRHGYCAKAGMCYPASPKQCLPETGGTCSVGRCKKSRGATKCKSGSCLCKSGGCAWKGRCMAVTDTGGTCSLMSCKSSRGPTTCHRGRCLCQHGYVAVKGKCKRF